jgi:ankyrin repeat protein
MADTATRDGVVPLTEAVRAGRFEEVQQLVQGDGALAGARDQAGVSLVMVALYHGHQEIATWLAARRADGDVFEAAALGDAGRVNSLVGRDPGLVHAFSVDGFTGLALASFFGRHDVVSHLLDRGADVNAVARLPPGYTPLTGAVTGRHAAVVAELLRRGANVNYRYGPGYSPLHAAAASGSAEIVGLLLAAGADAGARTDDGKTPGDMARDKGHVDAAALLDARP